jgi:O-antigen/teichoic acid export membrane protein
MKTYLIANIISMIVLFIGIVNMIVFREIWILVVVASILVILAIYAVREKRKLNHQPYRHSSS